MLLQSIYMVVVSVIEILTYRKFQCICKGLYKICLKSISEFGKIFVERCLHPLNIWSWNGSGLD